MRYVFFGFFIAFFPFILILMIMGSEYVNNPLYRIVFIAIATIVYILFGLFRKKYTNRHGFFGDIEVMEAIQGDIAYSYNLKSNEKDNILGVDLFVENIYGYDFGLKFETPFEKFFKSFGFDSECQTKEEKFDKTIYIISDDEILCKTLQDNSELRNSIYDIFWTSQAKGITLQKVECFDGRLFVSGKVIQSDFSRYDASNFFKEIVPMMKIVGDNLPPKATKEDLIFREKSSKIAFVFRAIMMAMITNSALVLIFSYFSFTSFPQLYNLFDIVSMGLKVTAIIFIIFAFIIFISLRKSSRLVMTYKELLIIGSIGIFSSSLIGVRDANIYLDTSKPQILSSMVTEKYTKKGRRSSTRYYLVLSNLGNEWNGENSSYKIRVNSGIYHDFNVYDGVLVYTHSGFLGYEWIEKMEHEPKLESKLLDKS